MNILGIKVDLNHHEYLNLNLNIKYQYQLNQLNL